ncbi:TonB-dependent siderophore receptor [Rhizobium sp. AAP43]|uniref:TonB-dependent siderophore receptor n=1 Tax=Rhizobium sp. AAP43 TaxID=1523420 RepID=UPI0006B9B64D|nr:TonB-dependent siderophore receptor [Rhizobium sp. AAP43]KPF42857.1 ferrichrome-iron receptor [Rhizobium sp. AAP43]
MNEFTRHRSLKRILLAGAALTLVSAPALGQSQDTSTELQTIVVEGHGNNATGPVEGYVAGESTTGSKTGTPITEIPQSVNVVGREEIEDRGVTNKVDEILRYTPGVMAQPFGADGDTDWIYIRGFDATQTGVFLDGLNLWSYGFGGFQVDPFFLERVEVLKGPASVLYGGANPGGIVNLVGKRPLDENRIYTETGINNHGTAFFNFDVNHVFEQQGVSSRLIGKIDGGDTAAGDEFRGVVAPEVTWSPDDATKLNVYGYYSSLDQQTGTNGFFPYVGTVVDAPFGKIDPDADYGEPSTDFSKIRQTMLGYEFEHEFENGVTFAQNARYGHVNRHENSPYSYGYVDLATGLLNRFGFEHETSVDSYAVDNRVSGEFETGALDHEMMAGLDYKNYELQSVQAFAVATPINATDPVYGVPQPTNGVYLNQTLNLQQVGLYAQDQIRFGDGWIATLNGRYDVIDTQLEDHLYAGDYDSNDSAISGRVGLAYEFANGVTPYLSAGTFFNPVVGTTLGEALVPEEGYQYEAGIKYEPTSFSGLITASVFHITKQNWTNTTLGISTQVGEVEARGFELEGKVDLSESWKLLGSFTYQDLEVTADENGSLLGSTPYLTPDMQASVWVDYEVPTGYFEGLSLGAGLRYQGESWADMPNTKTVPDVVLADAALRYEKNDWGLSLNVNNLFDKQYVAGCQGTLVCGYGEGRTITFKLSKTW